MYNRLAGRFGQYLLRRVVRMIQHQVDDGNLIAACHIGEQACHIGVGVLPCPLHVAPVQRRHAAAFEHWTGDAALVVRLVPCNVAIIVSPSPRQ